MRARCRTRWVLKWVGTGVCLLVLLMAVTTLRWSEVGGNTGKNYAVSVYGGALFLYHNVKTVPGFIPKTAVAQRLWVLDYSAGQTAAKAWSRCGLRPHSELVYLSSLREVRIPLWLLFLAAGSPTVYLWITDRDRPLPGHCQKCGYNLTGNVSGRCPECGTIITEEKRRAHP